MIALRKRMLSVRGQKMERKCTINWSLGLEVKVTNHLINLGHKKEAGF